LKLEKTRYDSLARDLVRGLDLRAAEEIRFAASPEKPGVIYRRDRAPKQFNLRLP
jgi:hypothetical protein